MSDKKEEHIIEVDWFWQSYVSPEYTKRIAKKKKKASKP
jgi:hypothetical protein